jgi:hypothetical protein
MSILGYLNWGTNMISYYVYSTILWAFSNYYYAVGIIVISLILYKVIKDKKSQ